MVTKSDSVPDRVRKAMQQWQTTPTSQCFTSPPALFWSWSQAAPAGQRCSRSQNSEVATNLHITGDDGILQGLASIIRFSGLDVSPSPPSSHLVRDTLLFAAASTHRPHRVPCWDGGAVLHQVPLGIWLLAQGCVTLTCSLRFGRTIEQVPDTELSCPHRRIHK